jgi:hypothetical protein
LKADWQLLKSSPPPARKCGDARANGRRQLFFLPPPSCVCGWLTEASRAQYEEETLAMAAKAF